MTEPSARELIRWAKENAREEPCRTRTGDFLKTSALTTGSVKRTFLFTVGFMLIYRFGNSLHTNYTRENSNRFSPTSRAKLWFAGIQARRTACRLTWAKRFASTPGFMGQAG